MAGDVILIWPALALGIGSILALTIVFLIFFQTLTRRSSLDYFLTINILAAGGSLITLLSLLIASVIAIIAGFISHISTNGKWYFLALVVGVFFAVVTPHNAVVVRNIDKYSTQIILPVYNEVILPVANLIRIIYEVSIPWWNFLVELIRLVPQVLYTTLKVCTGQVDGRRVIINIIQFVQALFTFLSAILADLESEMLISDIYAAFVNIFDPFTSWLNCFCQEFSFAWNMLTFYLHQENFQKSGGPTGILIIFPPSHDLINAIYALVRTILRFAAILVIDALDGGTYDPFKCGSRNLTCTPSFNGTCNFYIDCQINRGPRWNDAFDYACDFVHHWLGSLDDVIWCVILLFVNANADAVPRPFSVFAGIICFLIRLTQGLLDFIFKIDLVFDLSIRYASKVDITLQFDALRETPIAIEALFDVFLVEELHYIGCAIGKILSALIGIIEFVFKFGIAFASFDLDHISTFLSDYPYTMSIAAPFEQAILCAEKALEIINVDWAIAFKYTLIVFSRLVLLIVLTFSRFNLLFSSTPEDYLYWYADNVIPLVFSYCDTLQRWCISLGNCIRTFDKFLEYFGMDEQCVQHFNATSPAVNQTAFIVGITTHSNLFCVSGDAFQVISQFIVSVIQLVVQVGMSIVSIIARPSTSQGFLLLRNLLDNLKYFLFKCIVNAFEVINGFLSALGSFFGCQDDDGNFIPHSGVPSVGTKLKLLFSSFTNITNFPLNIIVLNGETLGLVIQCAVEPTSTPIFLQDPTGCEGQFFQGSPIGPPIITSCSISSLFDNVIDVICRYIFEFWDHVFIWFPFIIVRLVDFILCLAKEGTANNTYFNSFFDFLNTIRCLICDIVKIVVAILRAFIYLFTDGGFYSFIQIIQCFPPINTIAAVINTVSEFLKNIPAVINQSTSFKSIYIKQRNEIAFFCAPRSPPCGPAPDMPMPVGYPYVWPPPFPSTSPQLPCWIVNTFLFKRNSPSSDSNTTKRHEKRDEYQSFFTSLPSDGQTLLIHEGWTWNPKTPAYNYTMPQSPCYASYQYVKSTANVSIADSSFWLNVKEHSWLTQCVISSEFANKINSILPFTVEHPLPPDFLVNMVSLVNYTLSLVKDMYSAASYISYRTSVGGSNFGSWNDFKTSYGITNNFPLALVSLFDQATASASMLLSALDQYPRYADYIQEQNQKRTTKQPFSWDEWRKANDFLFPANGTNFLTGKVYHEGDDDDNEDEINFNQNVINKRTLSKRIVDNEPIALGDLISTEMNIGHTFGLVLHSSVGAWKAFEGINNQLARAHIGDLLWKRMIKGKELKRKVLDLEVESRRKRGDGYQDPETMEFSLPEIAEMQSRYNAYSIKSHAIVMVNFTQTTFFKIGDVMMRAYNNTFRYQSTETESPFLARRGIRNFIMTFKGQLDKYIPGRSEGGSSIESINLEKVYQRLGENKEALLLKKRLMPHELPPPPKKRALILSGKIEDTIQYQKRSTGSLKYTEMSNEKVSLIKHSQLANLEEMVHLNGKYYTRYEERVETHKELTIYEKRDDLAITVNGHEVFFAINYPDGGFAFGNKLFPLSDMCIGPTRISDDLPPPFGNRVLPGFCFNCNLLLNGVNAVVFYMATAMNDTRNITTRLDVDSAIDPYERRREMKPCTTGPPDSSNVTCCGGECECHTGSCVGAIQGTCSLTGQSCCSKNESNPNVCPFLQPLCNVDAGFCHFFISTPCTFDSQCPSANQTCVNFTTGHCGPALPPAPKKTCLPFYKSGDTWLTFTLHLAWLPFRLIFDVCPEDAADTLVVFFTSSEDNSSSFLYWFEFVFVCDFVESTHCDSGDYSGTGVVSGFFWAYGSIILIAIFFQLLGVPSVVFTFLFIFSPVLWLSISYFYCPLCWPALPICLANDIYFNLYSLNVPCINWQPLFGNVVSSSCSFDTEQCYYPTNQTYFLVPQPEGRCPNESLSLGPNERYLPDCAADPYNFDSPLRPIFFALESIFPNFNNWVRNTNSPTMKYIREFPDLREGIDFAYDVESGSPSKDQLACFYMGSAGSFGYLIGYGLLFAIASICLFYVVQVILALINFLIIASIITIAPIVEFSNSEKPDSGKTEVNESHENMASTRHHDRQFLTTPSLSKQSSRIFKFLSSKM